MSLFDIYKAKTLGAGAGSLFDVKAGGKLNKDAWKKGYNKWDEEWESGTYNATTGEKTADGSKIRSKNAINILPDTKYCGVAAEAAAGDARYINLLYYDSNGGFISKTSVYSGYTFTAPSNAYLLRIYMNSAYGKTYNNDICINISGEHDGEYVPYNG